MPTRAHEIQSFGEALGWRRSAPSGPPPTAIRLLVLQGRSEGLDLDGRGDKLWLRERAEELLPR